MSYPRKLIKNADISPNIDRGVYGLDANEHYSCRVANTT